MNRVATQVASATTTDRGLELDVTLFWSKAGDRNALAQKNLPVGTNVVIGEGADCHFTVPSELLGATSHVLVSSAGGEITVTPPANASVFFDALPRVAAPFVLGIGHAADVTIGDFTIRLGISESEDKVAPAGLLDGNSASIIAGSGLAHAALFAAFAFFMPSMSEASLEDMNRDQMLQMKQYMTNIAEREQEQTEQPADTQGAADSSSPGEKAKDAEGAMGGSTPTTQTGKWSAKGDSTPQDAKLARDRALSEAADFGMLGLLNSAQFSDPKAPVVPWGTVLAGADKESHMGNLWGGDIGDAFGTGLGMSGNEQGGGGKGEGIGISDVGGLGHMLGNCTGEHCPPGGGIGHGGKPGGGHVPHGPSMRPPPDISTNGHLPPEVIQRIVRQNSGRMLNCYTEGLKSNPSLEGRVAVQFVIGRDGSVTMSQDTSGSDLADPAVRACVVKQFYNISFPEPKDGTVRVIYPMTFSPAG